MKSLRFLLIALTILGISCTVNSQSGKTVHGNHNVTKSERSLGSFTGVKVSSGVDVYLKQGDNESVTVEADENLHEYIITEVKGGILHVYTDANIREAERERVYVTMKEIKSIQTTSAGDIVGESPIRSETLELSASSAGDITLEIYTRELEVDISSSGDITLSGETEKMKADLSSAGDLKAYKLNSKEADLSVSSAGDADINVSEKLTARASSAGDINYMGDPKSIDVHTSSAGGIHRR
jgi:Putative auto-transporter adhesin, head GIN domain